MINESFKKAMFHVVKGINEPVSVRIPIELKNRVVKASIEIGISTSSALWLAIASGIDDLEELAEKAKMQQNVSRPRVQRRNRKAAIEINIETKIGTCKKYRR